MGTTSCSCSVVIARILHILADAWLVFVMMFLTRVPLKLQLKPKGKELAVTEQNKREYVDLLAAWRLRGT